ncbi:MAG: DNA primase [Nitrospiraceae bacterium]|nr:DNA primase [Nitrospiraceae bacterium]
MRSDKLLEDIKSRLDIIDVIGDYIELKKSGQNYKANCPFHSEKTPSFMASPGKQIYHCFGCNAGGDVIGFVMRYENMTFQEAVKTLAKKAGIQLSEYKFETGLTEKKDKLHEIQNEALRYFPEKLKKSKTVLSYLDKREINKEMVQNFSLGYADKDWKTLYEHLRKKEYEDALIAQSGLVFSGEKGFYDVFRNRLMFPIFNINADVIAFGGRAIDNDMPKYLNSPETMLFKKGETLYALNVAKDEIRKKDYAIVVEGYIDVIICHQHGFRNVIAPLGTALTSGHLQKIGRLTKKIVLVFDSDAAGIAAAKRSLSLLYEHGFKSKILLLPEGDDPDSFLRKKGSAAFQTALARSKSMIDFILGLKGEKTDNIRTAISIINNVKDMILKEELLKELSERSGVSETAIRKETNKDSQALKKYERGRQGKNEAKTSDLLYSEDVLLLSAIIAFQDKASYIFENIDIDEIENTTVKEIFKKIKPLTDKLDMNSILAGLEDEEKAIVTRLSLSPGFDLENVDINIRDCFKKMANSKLDEKIQKAKTAGDLQLLKSLLAEKHKRLGHD